MKYVEVKIRKPLYGNYVYVRDVFVERAISLNKKMRITVPNGVGIHDPHEWKETGKIMEKIFKRPDEPMILYGNTVNVTGALKNLLDG